MRVLFDHSAPFALAHGGFQIQIEQTAAGLREIGVEVDFMRWWDDKQRGDIIHYFGRPSQAYIQQAQQKGMKVVVADLLTELGSRSRSLRGVQKALMETARRVLPGSFTARLAWDSYRQADAVIGNTPWEAQLLREMFSTPEENIHVVPNGVEKVFLNSARRPRGPWLVCTATITQRKRILELGEAAVKAETPTWIVGKPYSNADPYAMRFEQLAKSQPCWVRYEGPIYDRARLAEIYREARGFVLLSTMETLSLSADEAAACECPLLLSDLPWARTVFGAGATYCSVSAGVKRTATALKSFYDSAPHLSPARRPKTWPEVGRELAAIYERLLSTSQ